MNPLRLAPLARAGLGRRKLRTILTIASVVVAFLLFGLLAAFRHALTGGVELAGADRLMVMHKGSFILPLPRSYLTQVADMQGVLAVSSQHWFGGYIGDERNIVTAIVTSPETLAQVYPEITIPPDQLKAWTADPQSALIGVALAKANKLKVGDVIPLHSNIYRRSDGSNLWPVKVAAIFNRKSAGDTNSLFIHYRYFNETITFGKDTVGWIVLRVKNPAQMTQVAHGIDARFANSPDETNTSDERSFIQGFVNQFGNIGKIVTSIAAAVFFTLLLVTANTMARSVRERTPELAVLKTLGFTAAQVTGVVVAESLLIVLIGAAIGLLLAWLMSGGLRAQLAQYLPLFSLTRGAWVAGLAIAVLLGLLSALMPAAQAWRLRIVDALQRG